MTEIEQWEKDLGEAIAKVAEGALVTKFIVIAETIDPESGDPQLEWMASSAMAIWDKLGFLNYCAGHYDGRRRDEDR